MSGQVFYQTKLTRDPIGNERGRLTLHYIIAVQTHDPDGNPYESHPEDRARETFNLMPGRGIDDPVNLTDIKEEGQKRSCNKLYCVTMVRFISSKKSEPQSSVLARKTRGSSI